MLCFAPLQAVDAVKRLQAADAVVSQLVEEAPAVELAHGIDDMDPTGVLTVLLIMIRNIANHKMWLTPSAPAPVWVPWLHTWVRQESP